MLLFLSQILAGSVLVFKFGILDGTGPAIDFLLWKQRETAFLSQIVAGSLLEADFGCSEGAVPPQSCKKSSSQSRLYRSKVLKKAAPKTGCAALKC